MKSNFTRNPGSLPRNPWAWALGIALVLLGGGLRFAYLGGGSIHMDEPIASAVVAHLQASRGFDTNWAHTAIGSRYGRAQYNFSSYYLTLAAWDRLLRLARVETGTAAAPRLAVPEAESPTAATPPPPVFLRAFSALAGTLVLIVALRLAWEVGGWWLALGVVAWLAVNPQLVQDSHYARPEAFLTLLTLGLVWAGTSRRPWSWRRGLAVGALFGFLTACKVTMLLCFWVPFLVCWDAGAAATVGAGWRGTVRLLLRRAAIVLGAILAGFLLGVPRVLGDLRGYGAGLMFLRASYGRAVGSFSHLGGGRVYDYLVRFYCETAGWWMVALFGVGLVAAVVGRRWRLALAVLAPVLTTAAFFGTQAVFFERNLSHVVPLFAIGACWGLLAAAQWCGGALQRARPVILATLFASTLLLPASLTARLVFQGFSGRADRSHAEAQAQIRARFPGTAVYTVEASLREAPRFLRWCWGDNGGPYLMLWRLSNGIPDPGERRALDRDFVLDDVGRIPGLFDDLSTPSELKEYFPCDTRASLVKGVRNAPRPGGPVSATGLPPH
jgi:hypothetical protein